MSANIRSIQNDLRAAKLDGWLFYDFRGRDPIAQNVLQLPNGMRTRRWYYFVPSKGQPKKLVHKIESESLAALLGDTLYYAKQDELHKNLKKILARAKTVAMQYSPKNEIPYVAIVDAGTIELDGSGIHHCYVRNLILKRVLHGHGFRSGKNFLQILVQFVLLCVIQRVSQQRSERLRLNLVNEFL